MDGDPSGLAWKESRQNQIKCGVWKSAGAADNNTTQVVARRQKYKSVRISKNAQHTNFSHHSETFLVVGASTAHKDGDLMLF